MAGQPRNTRQNSEQLRGVGIGVAGALCRPGRTEREEKVKSRGVSDPGPALFGPLRAGVAHAHLSGVSCPANCGPDLCSDRDRFRDQVRAEILARRAPVNVVMITRARSVVP